MKGFKTLAAGLLASLFMASGVQAETPKNLSELLKNVKSESIVESKENKAREAEFKNNRDKQAALLQQAREELASQQALGDQLKATDRKSVV